MQLIVQKLVSFLFLGLTSSCVGEYISVSARPFVSDSIRLNGRHKAVRTANVMYGPNQDNVA